MRREMINPSWRPIFYQPPRKRPLLIVCSEPLINKRSLVLPCGHRHSWWWRYVLAVTRTKGFDVFECPTCCATWEYRQ